MNNQQFRRLLIDNASDPSKPKDGLTPTPRPSATPMLGSRARSSIPMTPRNIGSSASELFQKQLREQRDGQNPQKKIKGSYAPRGSQLAAGYTDRAAQLRTAEEREDANSKEARIKALEDMVRLGQMEFADFETARDQIIGDDIGSVHLVKGLDRKLLARARAGEDVFSTPKEEDRQPADDGKDEVDVDEELDNLESADVKPLERRERVKQGAMPAPPVPVAGRKRTRDDILRELREARARAAEEQRAAMQPALGAHFKKIAGPKKNEPGTSRIEIDEKGREVLIVVDAQGNVKRKVKKQKPEPNGTTNAMPMPDKNVKPLGMDVPEIAKPPPVEEESDDIFADAGSDYNPFGNLDDDDEDSGSDDSEEGEVESKPERETATNNAKSNEPPSPTKLEDFGAASKSRNYFGTEMEEHDKNFNPMNDPSILSALKRASATKAADTSAEDSNDLDAAKARLARMRARLAEQDRDAQDMDMGFGSSRFDDQDDGEERPVKLTKWTGLNGDDDEGDGEQQGRGGQTQRKRGKKKKKSDKNDASTVLGVIERRKG